VFEVMEGQFSNLFHLSVILLSICKHHLSEANRRSYIVGLSTAHLMLATEIPWR
jgi:hypothetical protein